MRVHPKNRETNIKININRFIKIRFCIIMRPFHDIALRFQVDYGLSEVQPKENSYIFRFLS